MRTPVCPRCGGDLRAPGAWSSSWSCARHGSVDPLQPTLGPDVHVVRRRAVDARVPVWLPWPLPDSWLATGARFAGDDRTGPRAVALACSGPAPLGGMGELVLVSESPGVGLGAGLAGLDSLDPGAETTGGQPSAKVVAAGHPAPLWSVPAPTDRAVFVGEALGSWLWVILWPASAGYLMAELLTLVDLRESGPELDVPAGAPSPRLHPLGAASESAAGP